MSAITLRIKLGSVSVCCVFMPFVNVPDGESSWRRKRALLDFTLKICTGGGSYRDYDYERVANLLFALRSNGINSDNF